MQRVVEKENPVGQGRGYKGGRGATRDELNLSKKDNFVNKPRCRRSRSSRRGIAR